MKKILLLSALFALGAGSTLLSFDKGYEPVSESKLVIEEISGLVGSKALNELNELKNGNYNKSVDEIILFISKFVNKLKDEKIIGFHEASILMDELEILTRVAYELGMIPNLFERFIISIKDRSREISLDTRAYGDGFRYFRRNWRNIIPQSGARFEYSSAFNRELNIRAESYVQKRQNQEGEAIRTIRLPLIHHEYMNNSVI